MSFTLKKNKKIFNHVEVIFTIKIFSKDNFALVILFPWVSLHTKLDAAT